VSFETWYVVMNEFFYLGITAAFFVISGLYAKGCETL
jgi:hypothetical protein